jgi:hypothetical protein
MPRWRNPFGSDQRTNEEEGGFLIFLSFSEESAAVEHWGVGTRVWLAREEMRSRGRIRGKME